MALAETPLDASALPVDALVTHDTVESLDTPDDPGAPERPHLRDGIVARVLTAERDCGLGQTLGVRFERLRFTGRRLVSDVVVSCGGKVRREIACAIADADGFLTGGTPCRDDGQPDRNHRAAIRRLTDVALLDGWLDALLASVEARLMGLVERRVDELGPAGHRARIEPLEELVEGASGARVAADDLVYDGTLHGSLRLRVGCRLVARTPVGRLVSPEGRASRSLRRALLRGTFFRVGFGSRGAIRAAADRLAARLEDLHRTLSS